MVELNVRACLDADARGDTFQAAWRALSLALWEYRHGQPVKAEEWVRRCLAAPDANAPRAAAARTILALSLFARNDTANAQLELAAAGELMQSKQWDWRELGSPVQGFWFDRLYAEVLFREARQVIQGPHNG